MDTELVAIGDVEAYAVSLAKGQVLFVRAVSPTIEPKLKAFDPAGALACPQSASCGGSGTISASNALDITLQ